MLSYDISAEAGHELAKGFAKVTGAAISSIPLSMTRHPMLEILHNSLTSFQYFPKIFCPWLQIPILLTVVHARLVEIVISINKRLTQSA